MKNMYHKPVLVNNIIKKLITDKNGIYLDLTFGAGGHTKAILKKINKKGLIIAIDQDEDAIKNNKIKDKRLKLIHNNFKYIKNILKLKKIKNITGILADLGVSWHQFDTVKRGFSIRFDYKIDMRMNINSKISAINIINNYSKKKLESILYNYGEIKNSNKIVEKIIKKRKKNYINTTYELIKTINIKNKNKKKKINLLSRIFQALRIEVNQEINVLKKLLIESPKILKKGGRIAIISYHSLEDRLVKRFFKNGNFKKEPEKNFFGIKKSIPLKIISPKLIRPNKKEIKNNKRSRSAKLRIAEKI